MVLFPMMSGPRHLDTGTGELSKVVEELRTQGVAEPGWMGVQMQTRTPTLAKALGRTNTLTSLPPWPRSTNSHQRWRRYDL